MDSSISSMFLKGRWQYLMMFLCERWKSAVNQIIESQYMNLDVSYIFNIYYKNFLN